MDFEKLLTRAPCARSTKSITAELREDFKSIAPGTFHELVTHDGQEFAVMRLEDLQLLLELVGMRSVPNG